ncbi:ABC transporter permease [Prevotella scopos JCM 17725]|uniref:Transport permease protein n=1 Tax=Prevotella scopos JCM 17725 TaxID=1236518 RepID=A0AAX2F239_9BACT|nr:ABC transporter permease [Prevotella scopos]ANR73688.1 multidrug ABC transporter permease [Prevotella scopos JCM 17725]QUB44272.1 ABC transporter permease [Prevotella scopos JCM 17725]SHF68875.1 ABC-2 type transport system permease protein [Prevotella scopos JCM 17725]
MKPFFSFVIKETKHILRDKRTMLMLFGMPIVMMLLFGFAVTNDVRNVRVVIVMSNADNATQQVADRLAASEYFTLTKVVATPAEAEKAIRDQKADMAVVFAQDFASRKSNYQLIVDGTDPNMAQQWTAYAKAVIANAESSVVNSKLLYNPQMKSAYNFVPAIMGTLLMLICAMMTSISIVREKEKGTMEVLLVSPTKPLMMIIAKAVPYLVLAFVILIVILLMATFVLGVPVKGSLFWIFVISTIYILLALSLGLLISTVAKTQLVALLLSAMVLLMPIIMLSGMIFPIESMPQILQDVSVIIPTRYYTSAMRKLMIMGVGIEEVYFELTVLISMLIGLMSLALAKFNKRLE